MTTQSFNAEYQCEWPPDDNWGKLVELARQYHDVCEEFDKRVCTGMKNGIAIPTTGWEQGMISAHAREVRDRLHNDAKIAGMIVKPGDWSRAISYVSEEIYRKHKNKLKAKDHQ